MEVRFELTSDTVSTTRNKITHSVMNVKKITFGCAPFTHFRFMFDTNLQFLLFLRRVLLNAEDARKGDGEQ